MSGHPPAISLFRNASWGGASASVRLVFGLSTLLLSIRLVGAENYGYLALMVSVATFYVALVNSVNTIAVTRAAECRKSVKTRAQLVHLFSASWVMTLVGVAVLVFVSITLGEDFVRVFVYRGANNVVLHDLVWLVLLVAAMAGCQLLLGGCVVVLEGLGRFDLAARAQMAGPPLTFALVLGAFFMEERPGLLYIGGSYVAGAGFEMTVAAVLRWRQRYRRALWPTAEALSQLPLLLRHGLILQGASVVNIFFDPFNKFLLNHFVGPGSVTAYDIATKIVAGIRGLFAGAFRVFLQLAEKLGADGGEDYLKVLRYGMVPALLMHGAGGVLLALLSNFWLGGEVGGLLLFYFLLIPSSLGIIFAAPLYSALIGIRDLGFIFRMHVNLAVLNLVASTLLIPLLGLYGAGVGLTLTTAYNASAEYSRYVRRIGPIHGLRNVAAELRARFAMAALLGLAALLADRWEEGPSVLLGVVELVLLAGIALVFLREPLVRRVLDALSRRLGLSS
jgi:O-antigen/teichoic acid export membrane protein